jgi:hypothetical protein
MAQESNCRASGVAVADGRSGWMSVRWMEARRANGQARAAKDAMEVFANVCVRECLDAQASGETVLCVARVDCGGSRIGGEKRGISNKAAGPAYKLYPALR